MSVVHRFTGEDGNFNWEGAIPRGYTKSNTRGADGKVLIGKADGAQQFIVRYFRVEPGGWSAHEKHPHDHGVFILHGRARVLLRRANARLDRELPANGDISGDGCSIGCTPTARTTPTKTSSAAYRRPVHLVATMPIRPMPRTAKLIAIRRPDDM